LTMYFAWKTADVPEDFRDSGAIMYACFVQIQTWAIGVPMLGALGHSSADATYFGRILLVFIFAISGVIVVVGPKIAMAISIRRNPDKHKKKSRVKVSGLYQPNSMASVPSIGACQLDSSRALGGQVSSMKSFRSFCS